MTIRLYKSTDGNAPVLCGQRTSMVNVLRKILVDGYGDKPAAGWTMPFINGTGTRACFRNNGIGFFLQIDQESVAAANQIIAAAYEMMTSDSAGSNQFGITSAGGLTSYISSDVSTTARPWICIANDKYFYFFNYHGATAMPTSPSTIYGSSNYMGFNMFFGDFEKTYIDDGFACAFFRSTWAAGGRAGFGDSMFNTSVESHHIARSLSGAVGAIACSIAIAPPGAFGHQSLSIYNCFGSVGPVYNGQTPLMVSKAAINNGANHTLRGHLPGLLAPCHPFPYNNLATLTINGENYVVATWQAINGAPGASRTAQAFFKVEG